eukprot:GHVT01025905.1.p1 GENE.GHVT01025905.1~~GHVT01025905.1.p1  ORF type:complete len:131 (+),score=0.66 GHVT01025905.1:804-1196(+)
MSWFSFYLKAWHISTPKAAPEWRGRGGRCKSPRHFWVFFAAASMLTCSLPTSYATPPSATNHTAKSKLDDVLNSRRLRPQYTGQGPSYYQAVTSFLHDPVDAISAKKTEIGMSDTKLVCIYSLTATSFSN